MSEYSELQSDKCLNCGKLYEPELWGAKCDCNAPNVVHQGACDHCGRVVGFIIDDDYCGPAKLYCTACVTKGVRA